ncbi:unnamed protein product, partial [Rangifer tarandus platyrhynchus]
MSGGNSARGQQLPKPVRPLPVLSNARSHCKEEPAQSNEDLAQPERQRSLHGPPRKLVSAALSCRRPASGF